MSSILNIQNLKVSFPQKKKENIEVVHGISLELQRGEVLAIVGESGSGKSVSMMAMSGLIPKSIIEADKCQYNSESCTIDLLNCSEAELQEFRLNEISYVFQEPMTALNPLMKCGEQVMEGISKIEDKKYHVLQLFEEVQLPDIERIFNSYPHQLSGGQRQRVMIALALANNPNLLIADEPTTALDAVVQDSIVQLLAETCKKRNMGLIFISHDLNVVKKIADRVMVMLKGNIVELGKTNDILEKTSNEYTLGLLSSKPSFEKKGQTLSVYNSESGKTEKSEKLDSENMELKKIMSFEELSKAYYSSSGFWGRNKQATHAVKEINLDLFKGETLGLVGESGCGKSTLAKMTARLVEPSTGKILFDGKEIGKLKKDYALKVQMIFQDPYSSLNPVQKIGKAILEPILVHQLIKDKKKAKDKVVQLLEDVGLSASDFSKYPHEFSGGQRQRICIARALAIEPELIICDESVSALDVSVQAKILNLLQILQRKYQLTYLFISHDLNVVSYLCDRIVVMKEGELIEVNTTENLLKAPKSDYSKHLMGFR